MKRWIVLLFLLPALVGGLAPAQAAGIRSTREYQNLKSYVQQLNDQKNKPQTQADIQRYRSGLSQRRAKAAAKVRALYQDQLSQAQQRRDDRKAKVMQLKARKKQTLADLRQAEQGRLNAIAADRRAALARIQTQYSSQTDKLTKQRNKLQRQIDRATNPLRRADLREELRAVQDQIDALAQEKQDDIRIANNKFDDKAQRTRTTFDQRTEKATEQADKDIADLQQQLRELYQTAKENAQQRRAAGFADVKAQYQRGVGYIDQMQQPQPEPQQEQPAS